MIDARHGPKREGKTGRKRKNGRKASHMCRVRKRRAHWFAAVAGGTVEKKETKDKGNR